MARALGDAVADGVDLDPGLQCGGVRERQHKNAKANHRPRARRREGERASESATRRSSRAEQVARVRLELSNRLERVLAHKEDADGRLGAVLDPRDALEVGRRKGAVLGLDVARGGRAGGGEGDEAGGEAGWLVPGGVETGGEVSLGAREEDDEGGGAGRGGRTA